MFMPNHPHAANHFCRILIVIYTSCCTLMPHTTGDPSRIIRILRRGEEPPIRLLTRQSLFGRDDAVLCLGLPRLEGGLVLIRIRVALLLRFHFSPVVRLSLLAVVDQEGERGRQADDDEGIEDAVVQFGVVVVVATGHVFWVGIIVIVVCAVVVRVRVFEEVGDPFAKGPIFLGFWRVVRIWETRLLSGLFCLTWLRLY